MKIIYLGTMFSASGNPTTIHTLTPLLRSIIPVKTASPIRNKFMRLMDMVRTVLQARRNDVVMIDTYSTLAYYYAWLCGTLCNLRGMKYIAYLHGGNLPARITKNRKWQNRYFTNASMIIAPSTYLKKEVEASGIGPVRLIPNFIRLEIYPFKQRSRVRPRLLWVRAFHNIYNPEMAIRVLAALRFFYPDASLCMVGPDKDGSIHKCKQLAASLGVSRLLRTTGLLMKEEWAALSEEYDIFINTTNFDNTPVSVMEAMALGLPIISTKVGGIPHLLQHEKNCLLVQRNEDAAMIDAVIRLMNDPVLVGNISFSARQRAEQFSWDCIKDHWTEVIENYA